jgi:hypothetical protein
MGEIADLEGESQSWVAKDAIFWRVPGFVYHRIQHDRAKVPFLLVPHRSGRRDRRRGIFLAPSFGHFLAIRIRQVI